MTLCWMSAAAIASLSPKDATAKVLDKFLAIALDAITVKCIKCSQKCFIRCILCWPITHCLIFFIY